MACRPRVPCEPVVMLVSVCMCVCVCVCACACVRVLKLMLAGSFTACVLGLALSYHHCNRVIFNPKRQWCCSM